MADNKAFGPDIFNVSGKIVLITGAGSGLGAGYAAAFGKYGSVVACAGRNMERLEKTVSAITEAGGRAKAYKADVTDMDSIRSLVDSVVADFGRIDVLVNNAGYENIQPFLEVTPEVYDDIMAVNMKGAFFTAQEAARAMKKKPAAAKSSTSVLSEALSVLRSPASTALQRAASFSSPKQWRWSLANTTFRSTPWRPAISSRP